MVSTPRAFSWASPWAPTASTHLAAPPAGAAVRLPLPVRVDAARAAEGSCCEAHGVGRHAQNTATAKQLPPQDAQRCRDIPGTQLRAGGATLHIYSRLVFPAASLAASPTCSTVRDDCVVCDDSTCSPRPRRTPSPRRRWPRCGGLALVRTSPRCGGRAPEPVSGPRWPALVTWTGSVLLFGLVLATRPCSQGQRLGSISVSHSGGHLFTSASLSGARGVCWTT